MMEKRGGYTPAKKPTLYMSGRKDNDMSALHELLEMDAAVEPNPIEEPEYHALVARAAAELAQLQLSRDYADERNETIAQLRQEIVIRQNALDEQAKQIAWLLAFHDNPQETLTELTQLRACKDEARKVGREVLEAHGGNLATTSWIRQKTSLDALASLLDK
jgi:hypothetical protein